MATPSLPATPLAVNQSLKIVYRRILVIVRVYLAAPKSRRVWGQHFVNKNNFVTIQPKFKFCVGNNDTFSSSIVSCLGIKINSNFSILSHNSLPTILSACSLVIFSSCSPCSALVEGVKIGVICCDSTTSPIGIP